MNALSIQVEVSNELGFHARPANAFMMMAQQFEAEITVTRCDNEASANGKSTLSLLTLAMCKGTSIQICATGADAEQALEVLGTLVRSGFGESEST